MKTIVFVCLLSLSMCLSQPTLKSEASPAVSTQQSTADPKTPTTPNTENKPNLTATNETTTLEPTTNSSQVSNETKTSPKDEKPIKPIDNKTDNKSQEKGTSEKQPTEKTPAAETKPATTTVKPTNEIKADGKANNAIVPTEKDKKKSDDDKTTIHPTIQPAVMPTVAPNVTEKPTVLARGFDGASFVGGIILTLGLLAIGFMGFKYYKNQTERNYHTL